MSRFLSPHAQSITPYKPGEHPKGEGVVKLNTNECPYPPSPKVAAAIAAFDADALRLYPDPAGKEVRAAAAKAAGVCPEQVFVGGGSDEVLAYAFMAFCPQGEEVCFPDVTYDFYSVYSQLFGLKPKRIPVTETFEVKVEDYAAEVGPIFLANPNAPTGIVLSPSDIEALLRQNTDRLLVLDEAYIDFAPGQSCLSLIDTYDNLLIVRTASKSWALAGMRLGFAYGNPELIAALNRIQFSFNPYNLDRVSMAVALAALEDADWRRETVEKMIATRRRASQALEAIGFTVLPSSTNFLFAGHSGLSGQALCDGLRERNILVRYFDAPRTRGYVRISVGTDAEMDRLIQVCKDLAPA